MIKVTLGIIKETEESGIPADTIGKMSEAAMKALEEENLL